jgi:predicted nucleotidyltransferase
MIPKDELDSISKNLEGEGKLNGEMMDLIKKAAEKLKAAGAREVYLFGSAVRGTLEERSDIDLAVSGLPPEKFFQVLAQVEDIFQRPIDLVDLDEENPFTLYLREENELQALG